MGIMIILLIINLDIYYIKNCDEINFLTSNILLPNQEHA